MSTYKQKMSEDGRYSHEEFNEYNHDENGVDIGGGTLKIVLELNHEQLSKLAYPIVVQCWHLAVGKGAAGSKRKQYQAEFTEAERRKARKYYNTFYRWYLVQGTPQKYITTTKEYQFMKRLVHFFATV